MDIFQINVHTHTNKHHQYVIIPQLLPDHFLCLLAVASGTNEEASPVPVEMSPAPPPKKIYLRPQTSHTETHAHTKKGE